MNTTKNFDPKQLGTWIVAGLCVAALAAYFWFRGNQSVAPENTDEQETKVDAPAGNHPLASNTVLDLCQMLDKPASTEQCALRGFEMGTSGALFQNKDGTPLITANLITNQNVSLGQSFSTKDWLAQAIPQIKQSGRSLWKEPKGAWKQAILTKRGDQLELIIEDDGILLVLQSEVFEEQLLIDYATTAIGNLRERKAVIPSMDAAIQ
jgi:hypothetical protein